MIDATRRTRMLLLAGFVPVLVVVGVLVAAALDGGGPEPRSDPPRPLSRGYAPAGTERIDVGAGALAAAVFRPRAGAASNSVVVFLHGWAAVDPRFYGPWIAHLVGGGTTVVYPAYQVAPFLDTISPLANMLVAVKAALTEIPAAARSRLVVAGHSAGGALAADYAASALAARLPPPAAVFSVYPGRSLRGVPLRIPAIDARRIPAKTRLLILAGERDRVVGARFAREIARTATRARVTLRIIRDDAVDGHDGPQRSSRAARRTFWAALDRLVAGTG